ncbi:RNase H domain-containing protein [Caerostris extrusa]|uniref:RNase H domain-containing protein n=1 Tax=Caerostris extrusa TaxID=172846 RepID=A0AAV4TW17_CAEEX|nr:RNase H domain-containing protein [Caerostris extrusa]
MAKNMAKSGKPQERQRSRSRPNIKKKFVTTIKPVEVTPENTSLKTKKTVQAKIDVKKINVAIKVEDIQIGDRNITAEDLETNNSILAPWEKTKFGWRYLRPEEEGYCIFTDGSKKDNRVGCAIVILGKACKFRNKTGDLMMRLLSSWQSFMQSEWQSHIITFSIPNAKIITDSRSVLQAINNPSNNSPSIISLKELLKLSPSIELIWTRAHIGVAGNESADIHAKLGTEKPIIDSFHKMPLNLLKSQLLKEKLKTWQQLWSTSIKGREVFQLCPVINLKRIHGNFFINQIITGHGAIAKHQARFFSANPVCFCGTAQEDRDHIIFHCSQWSDIRKDFFPEICKPLTPSNSVKQEGQERSGGNYEIKLQNIIEAIQE